MPPAGPLGKGHVLRQDEIRSFQGDAALDDVLQLADVARELIIHKQLQGVGGNVLHLLAKGAGVLLDEMPRQQGDVLLALPQGRQVNGNYVQTPVEVLPEAAVLHFLREILVCNCDDAHIDFDVVLAADTPKSLFLNNPQELHLQAKGRLGDLIEEDRATVGNLEEARLVGVRSRKGPFPVAEELALEQVFGVLMTRKGCSHRGLYAWIALATSSLPVPLSPGTRTFVGV